MRKCKSRASQERSTANVYEVIACQIELTRTGLRKVWLFVTGQRLKAETRMFDLKLISIPRFEPFEVDAVLAVI